MAHRAKRHLRRIRVVFRKKDEKKRTTGYTLNVSATGMFIASTRTLPPDTRIQVELASRDTSSVLEAVVVREKRVPPELRRVQPGGIGVRFLRIEELVQELLPSVDLSEYENPDAPEAAHADAESDGDAEEPPTGVLPAQAPDPEASALRPLRVQTGRLGELLLLLEKEVRQGVLFVRTSRAAELGQVLTVQLIAPNQETIQFQGRILQRVKPDEGEDEENLLAGVEVEVLDKDQVISQIEALVQRLRGQ